MNHNMTVADLVDLLTDWSPDTEVRINHPTDFYEVGSVSFDVDNVLNINVVGMSVDSETELVIDNESHSRINHAINRGRH